MLKLADQMFRGSNPSNHFEFTFTKGEHKGESYKFSITQPPIAMTELCTTLELWITNLENFIFSYTIGIDADNEQLAILEETSLVERNFTESFIAELERDDWNFFNLYSRALTNRQSEEFTDFASLEVDFSDLVDPIEKNGEYIKYHEIFPNANRPKVTYKDKIYYIEDEYFISHYRSINQVGLCCMVIESDSWFDWENPKTRFANFDYTTQLFSRYEDGVFYDQAFFAEVKKQLPDLVALLEQRHANLRLVYENYCKRAHLHFPSPVSTVQSGNSLNSLLSPKIGRNYPCPCGSGKKYKKCCMS